MGDKYGYKMQYKILKKVEDKIGEIHISNLIPNLLFVYSPRYVGNSIYFPCQVSACVCPAANQEVREQGTMYKYI